MNLIEAERSKYESLWTDVSEYQVCPGKDQVERLMKVLQPEPRATLLDIGCGTGEAGLAFNELGLEVRWLDITDAGLHSDVPRDRFIETPLWSDWTRRWRMGFDYGFCCNVVESVPHEFTMLAIERIVSICRTTWFQIALPERSFTWWRDRLREVGTLVEARDLINTALYICEKK